MPRTSSGLTKTVAVAAIASAFTTASAQNCISLSGSTACPAFRAASVSTDSALVGLYPFLQYVSNTQEFDQQFNRYLNQGYVQLKYQNLLGCANSIDLSNTTGYYARYTASFLCNGIVQNSRQPCRTPSDVARPLCADSCAQNALSEQRITANTELCRNPRNGYLDQIRADFTNCALPAESLSGNCITGEQNEPVDCGYHNNLQGLCDFCRGSTENATDSCCVTSNSTGRCQDVTLPVFATMAPLFNASSTASGSSATASSTSTGTAAASSGGRHGLSGGAIAGIVIGSIVGFLLLLALIAGCCILLRRRRRNSRENSVLNQPNPTRIGQQPMTYAQPNSSQQGYEVLPGGRVARMSALQGSSSDSPSGVAAVAGGVPPRRYENSDSDPYGTSPESEEKIGGGIVGKRGGSPSSNSYGATGTGEDSSPDSNNFSSPEGVASGQSEQLPFFRDYYSQEEIHPNDKVSVLWAYQPRAGDEFELERGDMLKVVGIWDDGWATGVRISDRAEDYDGKHKVQRDSGVSNGSNQRALSPAPDGEIKAFPLVCVCLPEAWRKTVEGDASTESGSGGPPAT